MYKLIFATLLLLSQAQASSQAVSILQKTASAYASATSTYVEAKVNTATMPGNARQIIESSFVWVVSPPTMIRMQANTPMMTDVMIVSDGTTTWEYMSGSNHYTKKRGDATTITSRGVDAADHTSPKDEYARMMALAVGIQIPDYRHIATSLKEARLLPEETLKIGDASFDCYVIEATYGTTSTKKSSIQKTFWIDKGRSVVLREVHRVAVSAGVAKQSGTSAAMTTTTFSNVRINEGLPDDVFVFTPPKDATEVKDWSLPDSNHKKH